MDRIVKEGLKVDFHIHSYASHFKDKSKVNDGTINNLHILIEKLIENEVNMLAITDHDNFDYQIYSELKKEESKDNCIKKVLPAVEFSVKIQNEVLHIVTLFDDADEDKIKTIQSHIYNLKQDKPEYDQQESFSEEKYIEILRNIGTNVILIAHQKGTLSSKKPRKHDANILGEDKLEELVFIDYFEAYEFKNKRNEIFNKNYIENQKIKLKGMRFVTGTDCHNWDNYSEDCKDDSFNFSFFKCLPSFRGVMMAITEPRRIKIGSGSFFSANAPIKSINLSIKGIDYNIELSKGINVIIGDNSIGKSLLIHKITDYNYINNNTLKKAYEDYLSDNGIYIKTKIDNSNIRHFDKQGGIRELFNNKRTSSKDFLNEYYPADPKYDSQKSIVIKKVDEFIDVLRYKQTLNDKKSELREFHFNFYKDKYTSLQINEIKLDFKSEIAEYINLISSIEETISMTSDLIKSNLISDEERQELEKYNIFLNQLKIKYTNIKKNKEYEMNKVVIINQRLNNLSSELMKTKTDIQKEKERCDQDFEQLANTIIQLLKLKRKMNSFNPMITEIPVIPNINKNGEYKFICGSDSVSKIDTEYIIGLLKNPLSSRYKKGLSDLNNFDIEEFKENIQGVDKNEQYDIFELYRQVLISKIDTDFKIKRTINNSKNGDIRKALSNGANSQIYFDLLSGDVSKPGIYIIDQPEDDVSQPSIKKKILPNFKKISDSRQILMITHNPQFIINLDVDNIIFIKKDETGAITIESGALEYKDDKTDILKIVVDNIEGGIDSLKERYRKYDKNN